jgi:hypothetical protein
MATAARASALCRAVITALCAKCGLLAKPLLDGLSRALAAPGVLNPEPVDSVAARLTALMVSDPAAAASPPAASPPAAAALARAAHLEPDVDVVMDDESVGGGVVGGGGLHSGPASAGAEPVVAAPAGGPVEDPALTALRARRLEVTRRLAELGAAEDDRIAAVPAGALQEAEEEYKRRTGRAITWARTCQTDAEEFDFVWRERGPGRDLEPQASEVE